jgi:hypothetical protein
MKTLSIDKRSVLGIGLVTVLVGVLLAPTVLAAPPAGSDPNNPFALGVAPDETVVRTGELEAGEEVWYAITVTDAAGLYTDAVDGDNRVDKPPLDLTLAVTPVDGNTIQKIRMELFPASYADHWSHGHIFVEGADTDDEEFHSFPFGMGTMVDRAVENFTLGNADGDPRLGTLVWSGNVSDKETVLVRVANENGSAVDYALYTDNIVDNELGETQTAASTSTSTPSLLATLRVAAGTDPNNAIPLSVTPDESIARVGQLAAGEAVWYEVTVNDLAGLYLSSGSDIDNDDLDRVPFELTAFVTPVDGNKIQQIRMDLFPASYAAHWSHGHAFDESLVGDDDLHAVPFGAGRIVERGERSDFFFYTQDGDAGDQLLGTLAWSGMLNNAEPFLVSLRNGNGSAIDYALFTDQIVNAETDQFIGAEADEAGPAGTILAAEVAMTELTAGIDPNNAIPLSVAPDETVSRSGELAPGQDMWFAVTVDDVAGLYLNHGADIDDDGLDRVPVDMTLLATPVDGNTIRQIRMDLFPASYAAHWSHGHAFDESLVGDDDLHAVPFGAGRIVERGERSDFFYYTYDDDAGDQFLGTLAWSGKVNNGATFLVRIENGNEFPADFILVSDQVVNNAGY